MSASREASFLLIEALTVHQTNQGEYLMVASFNRWVVRQYGWKCVNRTPCAMLELFSSNK